MYLILINSCFESFVLWFVQILGYVMSHKLIALYKIRDMMQSPVCLGLIFFAKLRPDLSETLFEGLS